MLLLPHADELPVADAENNEQVTAGIDGVFFLIAYRNSEQMVASGDHTKNHVGIAGANLRPWDSLTV